MASYNTRLRHLRGCQGACRRFPAAIDLFVVVLSVALKGRRFVCHCTGLSWIDVVSHACARLLVILFEPLLLPFLTMPGLSCFLRLTRLHWFMQLSSAGANLLGGCLCWFLQGDAGLLLSSPCTIFCARGRCKPGRGSGVMSDRIFRCSGKTLTWHMRRGAPR